MHIGAEVNCFTVKNYEAAVEQFLFWAVRSDKSKRLNAALFLVSSKLAGYTIKNSGLCMLGTGSLPSAVLSMKLPVLQAMQVHIIDV